MKTLAWFLAGAIAGVRIYLWFEEYEGDLDALEGRIAALEQQVVGHYHQHSRDTVSSDHTSLGILDRGER